MKQKFIKQISHSFIIIKLLKSYWLLSNLPEKTPFKMHILQSKHTKLNNKEVEELLEKLNVSKAQLPKIFSTDPGLPENCEIGNIIKIERKIGEETEIYFRVVV